MHLQKQVFEAVDLEDVFILEAVGDETRVRLRGRKSKIDVRPIATICDRLGEGVFFRIHRSHAVNLDRVHLIRRRAAGRDWEVKMEPPVNRVLPVSRGSLEALIQAMEGDLTAG